METTTPEREQRTPTRAQKDGRACIDCSGATGPFRRAGYVYTRCSDGGRLPWAVVACDPACPEPRSWTRLPVAGWPLSPAWLIPAGSKQEPGEFFTALMPAGVLWDAVRTRLDVGEVILERLLAEPDDRDTLGPVLRDARGNWMYWLITLGSSDSWPDGVELRTIGAWLRAPTATLRTIREATWAHLPDGEHLTSPAWLATALAVEPRPAP